MASRAAQPLPGEPLYAWLIVPLAALGMVATLPGRTHGLGMITERTRHNRLWLARRWCNILLADTLIGLVVAIDPANHLLHLRRGDGNPFLH